MNSRIRVKNIVKVILDIVMTFLLMFLMSYMLAGPQIHEWLGCAMFVSFIAHHLLNWNWHKHILKGNYNVYRIVQLLLNSLIFIGMFTSMITGIMLSKYVFAWINLSGGILTARKFHMLAAYWNFVFMAVHLGLHWSMMIGRIRKIAKIYKWIGRIMAISVAIYGGYLFIQENIYQYLFGTIEFAFYDFRQTVFQFVFNYLIIMECIVCITYYVRKGLFLIKQKS